MLSLYSLEKTDAILQILQKRLLFNSSNGFIPFQHNLHPCFSLHNNTKWLVVELSSWISDNVHYSSSYTRRETLRTPLRLWKSTSQRWGKCTAWTAKPFRGSKPETSCQGTSWRWQVRSRPNSRCHSLRLIYAQTLTGTHSESHSAIHSWVWKHCWNISDWIT